MLEVRDTEDYLDWQLMAGIFNAKNAEISLLQCMAGALERSWKRHAEKCIDLDWRVIWSQLVTILGALLARLEIFLQRPGMELVSILPFLHIYNHENCRGRLPCELLKGVGGPRSKKDAITSTRRANRRADKMSKTRGRCMAKCPDHQIVKLIRNWEDEG